MYKTTFSLLLVFACIMLVRCSNIYYVGETTEPVKVYSTPDTSRQPVYIIPVGSKLLTKKGRKRFHYVIYQSYTGYVYRPVYTGYHKYNAAVDGELYGYSSSKRGVSTGSSGGTVNVKGYYRKDGTYVRPHTRSAPKRRS